MTIDVLDPGPDGDYPHARGADGYLLDTIPIGTRRQRDAAGNEVLIDIEPTVRAPNGDLVRISALVPPRPAAS